MAPSFLYASTTIGKRKGSYLMNPLGSLQSAIISGLILTVIMVFVVNAIGS